MAHHRGGVGRCRSGCDQETLPWRRFGAELLRATRHGKSWEHDPEETGGGWWLWNDDYGVYCLTMVNWRALFIDSLFADGLLLIIGESWLIIAYSRLIMLNWWPFLCQVGSKFQHQQMAGLMRIVIGTQVPSGCNVDKHGWQHQIWMATSDLFILIHH